MPPKGADMSRPWIREIGLGDFPDTTSGAVSAEARYMWLKRMNPGGIRHGMELLTTVLLHLVSQLFQFVLIVYFALTVVEPIGMVFEPTNLHNMTHQLKLAMAAQNPRMLPPATLGTCTMNRSYPMSHRLMMFLLMVKLLPDLGNCAWLMYNTWLGEDHRNGDRPTIPEKEEHRVYTKAQQDDLVEALDNYKKEYCARVEHEKDWRDEDVVAKQWKARTLILNKYGNCLKAAKAKEFAEDDFPVSWIKQELDEMHNIGRFGLPWKLFCTCFIIVPNLFMNIYMIKVGSQLIASVGPLGKLAKTALKIKFISKIPESIFDGYASKELKEYIEHSSFYLRTEDQPTHCDHWATWLCPVAKVALATCMAYALYDWGYHGILEFRSICSEYFDQFEGQTPNAAVEEMFAFW